MLTINKILLTKNACYNSSVIVPKGIVVHSTGCNNPNLKRYIQPDDGTIGTNKNNNDWNRTGVDKCVHAFIGKDKNGEVKVYQTLPWTNCAWGVGKGKKGSYNYSPTGYIQFEICEDKKDDINYFIKCFTLAAELCAYLCKEYNLSVDNVVSHHEAYLRGYASNHGDCDNWLSCFGKNMDWFRGLVNNALAVLNGTIAETTGAYEGKTEAVYTTAQKGEGINAIAKRCGVLPKTIKALNPQIKAPLYIVRVGQKVRIA